jgi:Membrane-associated sensor, integral membrane domain
MQTTATPRSRDDFAVLTREAPIRRQVLFALGVVPGILAVVFCISRPFAGVQLRPIEALVPFYVTAMFLNGLITAVILFAQFSILRTRAILVIANGYLFLGLMAIPYTLSFPGVFEPGQSLIGGLQSTPWLYILRHCGFAIFVSAFALLKDSSITSRPWQGNVRQMILFECRYDDSCRLCGSVCVYRGRSTIAHHNKRSCPLRSDLGLLRWRTYGVAVYFRADLGLDPAAHSTWSLVDGRDVRSPGRGAARLLPAPDTF